MRAERGQATSYELAPCRRLPPALLNTLSTPSCMMPLCGDCDRNPCSYLCAQRNSVPLLQTLFSSAKQIEIYILLNVNQTAVFPSPAAPQRSQMRSPIALLSLSTIRATAQESRGAHSSPCPGRLAGRCKSPNKSAEPASFAQQASRRQQAQENDEVRRKLSECTPPSMIARPSYRPDSAGMIPGGTPACSETSKLPEVSSASMGKWRSLKDRSQSQ